MSTRAPVVLVAPDKFRGTLTAPQVVSAVTSGAAAAGWEVIGRPMADGGEGMLDAFGGANRRSRVSGPDGNPLDAPWRLDDEGVAVIESAAASGLALLNSSDGNDPMLATSRGTGELIVEAVRAGAKRVIVGLGGSAMTDGGQGALDAVLNGLGGNRPIDLGVDLVGARDVDTIFAEAARAFGPQKGATTVQVTELTARLNALQLQYAARFGIALDTLPGGGAAGGLGGGLVALGGKLVPGLELVANLVNLDDAMSTADLVITGEGALDSESFNGKVVGGVIAAARKHNLAVFVLTGTARTGIPIEHLVGLDVVDLSHTFGHAESWNETAACLTEATQAYLLGQRRQGG